MVMGVAVALAGQKFEHDGEIGETRDWFFYGRDFDGDAWGE